MRKILAFIFLITVLYSCGGGGSSDTKETPAPAPEKATLVAPAQNELCTQGTVISPTQSTVTLKWNAALNAESYDVNIKDLDAGTTTTQTTTTTQVDVNLKRNTAYSWAVTSKSTKNSTTAQSDFWKFYNSGPAATNYAPFPADLTAPSTGQKVTAVNGKVTLSWNGSDVDNDIAGYNLYWGTSANVTLLKSGITASPYSADVVSGSTYYWKIITIDSKGNTSDSGLAQFSVN
ncbi:hypothetical protein [Mucilaginibacter jinjuensis]|uniref:Fibronectin type-III domain-containing protein n=1 Tax=Mucilaginibacter jinjuensis TaxID=1176721 RepID=A0ABY7T7W3_9SPHI|nr:hypothetical protein [Mucilaginibacter jinjuensis]WCT12446.1 hypothetical protein PQO05_00690 [Mucilaginibacter jinjuensis]